MKKFIVIMVLAIILPLLPNAQTTKQLDALVTSFNVKAATDFDSLYKKIIGRTDGTIDSLLDMVKLNLGIPRSTSFHDNSALVVINTAIVAVNYKNNRFIFKRIQDSGEKTTTIEIQKKNQHGIALWYDKDDDVSISRTGTIFHKGYNKGTHRYNHLYKVFMRCWKDLK